MLSKHLPQKSLPAAAAGLTQAESLYDAKSAQYPNTQTYRQDQLMTSLDWRRWKYQQFISISRLLKMISESVCISLAKFSMLTYARHHKCYWCLPSGWLEKPPSIETKVLLGLCMRSTHSRVDNKITRELRELHLSGLVGRSHRSNLINPLILWVVVDHKLLNKAVKCLDLIAVWHSGRFAATHTPTFNSFHGICTSWQA